MKFIHAADLHLDSPFAGLTTVPDQIKEPVHQSTFTAFERIVDAAITNHVDFVLLVGDNFDTPQHSAWATDFFHRQLERLADSQIPVVVSYGNHDFQAKGGQLSYPTTVHILGPDVESVTIKTRDSQTVEVAGFSYSQRWLTDNPVADYPGRGGADWYIGTLHGALETGHGDHYAPFKLNQLINKHYDYWALGHVHAPQVLSRNPAILYSGTSQGRSVNESGPHGYQLVQSHDGKLVPHFHAVSPVEWNTIDITADHQASLDDLTVRVNQAVAKLTTPVYGDQTNLNPNDIRNQEFTVDYQPSLRMVTINVVGDELPDSLRRQVSKGVILSQLQDQVAGDDHWWPVAVHLFTSSANSRSQQLDAPSWQAAADEVFSDSTLAELTEKLVKDYPALADRINQPSTIAELRQRAMNLLQGGGSDED